MKEALLNRLSEIDIPEATGNNCPGFFGFDEPDYQIGDDVFELYSKEINNFPLLNAEQEIALAQQIEKGRQARKELADNGVPSTQQQELAAIIREGKEAQDTFICCNLRLVVAQAKRYLGYVQDPGGLDFYDLIQAGNIGMIRALRKYEWTRGLRFSSPAVPWIRQAIEREIGDSGREIRIPIKTGQKMSKIAKKRKMLQQKLNREPTIEELARETKIDEKKIRFLDRVSQKPISLETPLDYENKTVLADVIPDEKITPDQAFDIIDFADQVKLLLSSLPARDEHVVWEYSGYGEISDEKQSLKAVAGKFGLTIGKVRGIIDRTKERLEELTNS